MHAEFNENFIQSNKYQGINLIECKRIRQKRSLKDFFLNMLQFEDNYSRNEDLFILLKYGLIFA
jgi:hypothetical protein